MSAAVTRRTGDSASMRERLASVVEDCPSNLSEVFTEEYEKTLYFQAEMSAKCS